MRNGKHRIKLVLLITIIGGLISLFYCLNFSFNNSIYAHAKEQENQIQAYNSNVSYYTVIFDSLGGTGVSPIVGVPFGSTISLPDAPTKDGYTFEGWYTDIYGNYQFTSSSIVYGNLTLYAKWRQLYPTYLSATPLQSQMAVGDFVTSSDFNVWIRYDNGSTKQITNFSFSPSTIQRLGDNYIYITYEGLSTTVKITGVPERTYSVSFDSMGGSSVGAITGIKKNGTITMPSEPVRKGYVFQGWFTDKNGIYRFIPTTVITSDLVLYAYWSKENEVEELVYKLNMDFVEMVSNQQLPLFLESPKTLKVRYESDDEDVASVDENGIITAHESGDTTVYAILQKTGGEDEVFTCDVSVFTEISSLKLNASQKTLTRGKSFTIKAKFSPSKVTNKRLKYSSSNRKVAIVSSKGKITAKGRGSCIITVSTTDGSKISKKIRVIVK